jgi:chromosome segregation protein
VVITRRLSRSGDSEYLLNGASCRLRDIHDMLRGTGLGADSGIVIESKMIDALLSDRPDDRRELFEEAAGVGLYRDRRRSTERRLEETTVDLSRLDDLISEVQSQVRSLARQRKRAERHVELTSRRFSVELTLASREMAAWREELIVLEEKVATLREHSPGDETRVIAAEETRNAAHEARGASEARRSELARLALLQQQSVQALRSEIAVAEERQRNALDRRQRAEVEQREGEAFGERLNADRTRATEDLTMLEGEVATARESLAVHAREEDAARQAVAAARTAVDAAERTARELRDQQRRIDLDRESAQRESTELEQRGAALELERQQLVDAAAVLAREIESADEAIEMAKVNVAQAVEALEEARATARAARERDAQARAELGRAEDSYTALEGKVNALEGLERERVGLAPAAARLLRERERFGEGAVLGPISDFLTTSSSSAVLVERYLGMTVHAVVVRDLAAAEAVRAWHTSVNPGPLLLLPLDAAPPTAGDDAGDLLPQVEATAPAAAWVRSLLERVHALDEGSGFVDARGAVWLPGTTAGPGPLRRRAELSTLRAELQAAIEGRKLAAAAADEARRALAEGDAAVAAAAPKGPTSPMPKTAVPTTSVPSSNGDGCAACANSRTPKGSPVASPSATRSWPAASRHSRCGPRRYTLRWGRMGPTSMRCASRPSPPSASWSRRASSAPMARSPSRSRRRACRSRPTAASTGARSTRTRRSASQSLQSELSTLADSDRSLAEQMAAWQMDLDARKATLTDAEGRLAEAEQLVRDADAALDGGRPGAGPGAHRAHERESALHHAELRFTELSGRRTAIRERLETEWRRPLEELLPSRGTRRRGRHAPRGSRPSCVTSWMQAGRGEPAGHRGARGGAASSRLPHGAAQRPRVGQAVAAAGDSRDRQHGARAVPRDVRQVRENFRQIFMTLFGGGECDLRLENPELPLDCDIEVHASPRGKRTQRIHLLSSGERALVALSLLFGIFLTKPSPSACWTKWTRRSTTRTSAVRAHAQPVQDAHAVHRDHAQPAHHDGSGRCRVRCDDAGAGRLVARERAHAWWCGGRTRRRSRDRRRVIRTRGDSPT